MVWHVLLYSGSAGFLKLAGFVVVLWLAKRLSVEDYATWGMLFSLQVAVSLFGAVGIVESVIALLRSCQTGQDRARLFAAANAVGVVNLGVAILFAAVLYVLVAGRAWDALYTYCWVAGSGGLLAVSSLQAQFVRLEEKHTASLYFNFIAPLSGLIGSVVAVAIQMSAWSYYMGATIGLAVALIYGRARGIGAFHCTKSIGECRPILARVAPFIAVAFLGWLSGYGNNYVTELLFDSKEVAKCALAFMLAGLMQLVATAMNQVWSPRFYRLIKDRPAEEVEARNRRFFQGEAVVLGITGALLVYFFPIAAGLIGGNLANYESMRLELLLLVIGYISIVPFWHCQNYLLAFDKGPAMMRIHFVSSLIGVGVLVALLLWLGPLGIYLGFLVQMVLRSAAAVTVTRRRWRIAIGWEGLLAGAGIAVVGFLAGWGGAAFAP